MIESQAPAQLTVRAIVLAILLAVLLAAANTYLGLFAGMTIASAIPAAVVSMAVLRVLGGSTILENNIVQTGASAGSSIASGVIFTIPALVILGHWTDFRYSWVLAIAGLGGILGVFFSVPLRRSLIVEQNLKFPEGVAAAEVLKAGDNPAQGVKLLGLSALGGGLAKLAAGSGLRLDPGHGGHGWVLRQMARLLRHQPVARAARRRLHRRSQHRRARADRRHDFLEHRHPDLRRTLPRRQRRARAESRGRRCRDDRRRDLVRRSPVPGRRCHAGRRPVGAGLDPQLARVGHPQWTGRDARRGRACSGAHRAGPADEGDPGRPRAVHDPARNPLPADRRQPRREPADDRDHDRRRVRVHVGLGVHGRPRRLVEQPRLRHHDLHDPVRVAAADAADGTQRGARPRRRDHDRLGGLLRGVHRWRQPAGPQGRPARRRHALAPAGHAGNWRGELRAGDGTRAEPAAQGVRHRRSDRGAPEPADRSAGDADGLGRQGHVRWRPAVGHDRHRRADRRRHHPDGRMAQAPQCAVPRAGPGRGGRHLPAARTVGADLRRRSHRAPRRAQARRSRRDAGGRTCQAQRHPVRRRPDHR